MIQRRQRFRFVIEKDFQYRFTIRMCTIAGFIFLCAGGLLLYIVSLNYEMLIQESLLQMPEMVSQLRREFKFLTLAMVACFIFMVCLLFALGLALTQRVAGPLFALQRKLQDFSEGKHNVRLKLRRDDEFHSLEESFNAAMESYDQNSERIENRLQALSFKLRTQDIEGARNQLKEMLEGAISKPENVSSADKN